MNACVDVDLLHGAADAVDARVAAIEWDALVNTVDGRGNGVIERLLAPDECVALAALYSDEAVFRSRVVMARHGFGRGEYKYFRYPLPPLVSALRAAIYPHLVPLANRWNQALEIDARFPPTHAAFIRRCHAAGQRRPTPLLLQYGPDDYNCLHQDLYGEHVFPLQVAVLLAEPRRDFRGGEFVLAEQRPRMQTRAQVVDLHQGDAVVFAVHHRPVRGTRGFYRVNMRHGVSEIRAGHRHTLGIVFHDAN
ncbi:MAG TPA: 2OG-Fe(II) oxygenase [Casimicrobiaceae bacterium]|nr:2OG-Fe(II) oxygenase [Casimicrobiaceae bacterium]